MNEDLTVFDAEKIKDIYENQIKKHVDEITKICKLNDIPFFYAFATDNNAKETTYKFEGVLPGSAELNLKDDKFTEFLLIVRGLKAQRPGVLMDFDAKGLKYICSDMLGDNPNNMNDIGDI